MKWFLFFSLLFFAVNGLADDKTTVPGHEHSHPDLQLQLDEHQSILDQHDLEFDSVYESLSVLGEQGNTNALNIHNLELRFDEAFALHRSALGKLNDKLSGAVAAGAALNFNEPAVNGRGRWTVGTANYDGQTAFGISFTKKQWASKAWGLGVATDGDETLVKGQFAWDVGG